MLRYAACRRRRFLLNVYSTDKIEFLSNQQKCVEFKHRLFFVVNYSKEKRIVSKKTLVLEICGYAAIIVNIAAFVCSLWLRVAVAFVVLCVVSALDFAFGFSTGVVLYKAKRLQNEQ